MRIELSEYVEGDIQQIADYIAQDSQRNALRLVEDLYDAIQRIARSPLHYPLRPEIAKDARMAIVGRHLILFHVAEDTVRIDRVVFGGRDLPSLFDQL